MDDILHKIPHRPPFLFLDEIVEITETGAVGRRLIRETEPQFEGHYPGNPIMPGVLLCEATFQLAAVYLATYAGDTNGAGGKTPVLARIQESKFKQIVRPGDTITISVEFKETLRGFHFLTGKIRNQNDKLVLTNAFALAMVDEA